MTEMFSICINYEQLWLKWQRMKLEAFTILTHVKINTSLISFGCLGTKKFWKKFKLSEELKNSAVNTYTSSHLFFTSCYHGDLLHLFFSFSLPPSVSFLSPTLSSASSENVSHISLKLWIRLLNKEKPQDLAICKPLFHITLFLYLLFHYGWKWGPLDRSLCEIMSL